MQNVSTKTFYNYIHDGKVAIKPIDLPRMTRRKIRFYDMIPITSKSSKKEYMQINKFYDDDFINIFKFMSFDNGNEFTRWKDMEKKPRTKEKEDTWISS